jgi:hypothetical protein
MWLSKPVYEILPFCYVALGIVLTVAGFSFERAYWEEICVGAGITALVVGLVLLLKRRGYRASRSRLDFDETH